jgi:hypothetical protein
VAIHRANRIFNVLQHTEGRERNQKTGFVRFRGVSQNWRLDRPSVFRGHQTLKFVVEGTHTSPVTQNLSESWKVGKFESLKVVCVCAPSATLTWPTLRVPESFGGVGYKHVTTRAAHGGAVCRSTRRAPSRHSGWLCDPRGATGAADGSARHGRMHGHDAKVQIRNAILNSAAICLLQYCIQSVSTPV